MNRAVVVFNPISGSGRSEPLALVIEAKLRQAGWTVECLPTFDQRGATPVVERVANRIDFLVVVGGDGTLREAVAGLGSATTSVKIGIVPSGHANVVARELGIPLDLRAAVEVLVTGVPIRVDLGLANRETFLAMVGVGFDALAVSWVSRLRHTRFGRVWYRWFADSLYAVAGLLAMCDWKLPMVRLRVDGRSVGDRYSAALVCNFRTYSKGWSMAPAAHFQSGDLQYQLRKSHNPLFLIWHLLAAVFRCRSPAFISDYGGGSVVEVSCERPFPVEIDGDYRGTMKQLTLSLEPGALQVVVPKAAPLTAATAPIARDAAWMEG